jgi:hypothetical protein
MVKKQYASGTYNPAPKYHNDKRKSPPYSATDCIGETMIGNDGNEWKSEYVGKSYRWVLADGSDSKNKQSTYKHSVSRKSHQASPKKRKLWNLSDIRKSRARTSRKSHIRSRKSTARKRSRSRKSRKRSRSRKSASALGHVSHASALGHVSHASALGHVSHASALNPKKLGK